MNEQSTRPKRIFFSAGEPSGDLHAAELIEVLKKKEPNIELVGYGGPKMEEVGCHLLLDLTQFAIMWFGRALWNIRKFIKLIDDADAYFVNNKVDAVVLVDFPGLNWWIARKAKKRGVPVFYFMPPQIWSWARWRIKKMKKFVDYVLCCLPFEKRWFDSHGCETTYIGHPFFEEVRQRKLNEAFLEELKSIVPEGRRVLTLLPGSRNQEVHTNFTDFLAATKIILERQPNVFPVVAAFKDSQKQWIENLLREKGMDSIPVFVGRTPELIHAAECCIAVSGSVSLELLANKTPAVIYYRITPFAHIVQRFFRRSRYITLVNLLSVDREDDLLQESSPSQEKRQTIFFSEYPAPKEQSQEDKRRMLFPEFLTNRDRSAEVAEILLDWFRDDTKLPELREKLATLLAYVDKGESSMTLAADYILEKTTDADS